MEIRIGLLGDILRCWCGLDDLYNLGRFRVLMEMGDLETCV